MGSLLPTLRSRPAAAAPVPVPVEGLGPAEGRADFSEDFWRGWVADLSDAELATLHAIVEEQQAKKKGGAQGEGEGSAHPRRSSSCDGVATYAAMLGWFSRHALQGQLGL